MIVKINDFTWLRQTSNWTLKLHARNYRPTINKTNLISPITRAKLKKKDLIYLRNNYYQSILFSVNPPSCCGREAATFPHFRRNYKRKKWLIFHTCGQLYRCGNMEWIYIHYDRTRTVITFQLGPFLMSDSKVLIAVVLRHENYNLRGWKIPDWVFCSALKFISSQLDNFIKILKLL